MNKIFACAIQTLLCTSLIVLAFSGRALAEPIYLLCGPNLLNYRLALDYDNQTVVIADDQGRQWGSQIQLSSNAITWQDSQASYVLDRVSLKLRYKMHRSGSDGLVNCSQTQPSKNKI